MVRAPLIPPVLLLAAVTALAAPASSPSPFEQRVPSMAANAIDDAVFPRLQKLGIEPARPCCDAVFVRRVYLDVIGTLPTAEESKAFLNDPKPDKRRILIDRLMEREEFADYWAMKWADVLRVKAEFPINLWPHAAQAYHRWIWKNVSENRPCDQFVREMLVSSGSNFRVPPVNFYRALQSKDPASLAQAVALAFMGTRADKWPKERLEGMAAFFARLSYKSSLEWKEEIVLIDMTRGRRT